MLIIYKRKMGVNSELETEQNDNNINNNEKEQKTDNNTKNDKHEKKINKNRERALLYKMMFDDNSDTINYAGVLTSPELYDKVRIGGKGRTGASDFTKGKCAFARPCTVGWKSQTQPICKGGGNRTPL